MKEQNTSKEAGKIIQMQLKSPKCKNIDNQAKKIRKTQRSKSALKISLRRNVVDERRKKHDQS